MAKISLILDKRRARKDGSFPVCLKFSNINTAALYVTPYTVQPSQWRGGRVINHERAVIMNQRLHQLLIRANDTMEQLCGFVNRLPAVTIRDKTMTALEGGDACLLIPTFERFIKMKQKPSTVGSFNYTLATICKFTPHVDALTFDSITVEWLASFEKWLLARVKRNTCAIHLENLRAVVNFAVAEELTTTYAFSRFRIKREKSKPRVLTLEEMRALWRYETTDPYLRWYLDTFLLSFCLCGMNVADIYRLRPADVVNGRVEVNRQKTGVHLSIALTPEARAIIERMKGKKYLVNIAERYADHRAFLSRCNRGLHRIMPSLTTYYARHSWATIAASLGVSVDDIGQGLGQRNGSRVTNIYIQHDLRRLDKANEAVLRAVTE